MEKSPHLAIQNEPMATSRQLARALSSILLTASQMSNEKQTLLVVAGLSGACKYVGIRSQSVRVVVVDVLG